MGDCQSCLIGYDKGEVSASPFWAERSDLCKSINLSLLSAILSHRELLAARCKLDGGDLATFIGWFPIQPNSIF
jgi:hypothetical protein